jgi:NADH:ubiquinone oxidoreductase subunit 2 (subunit N)
VYYLRVAKTVCIDPEPESRRRANIGLLPAAYVLIVSLPVLIYGLFPGPVLDIAREARKQLLM